MTRRKPGDLAYAYRLDVSQPDLNELHVKVELVYDPRPRYAQWWVAQWSGSWGVFGGPPGLHGPISTHKTYEAAAARAHRNARVWLHSALGTGLKAPRRLP